MDSKPYDSKKLVALLAAARDLTGFPVTSITLRKAEDGIRIALSSAFAHTTTEASVWDEDHPLRMAESLLKPDTEPNKNS